MAGATADLVFSGGPVHTVDATNAIAEAVAVSDGRILAVGSAAAVHATAGPQTRHVDLRGRSLLPGFIDAHCHFNGVGASADAIDCKAPGMDSIAAIVEEVRKRAERQPAGTWIRGRGYDHTKLVEQRHPNRHDFDAVAPNHPVLFTRTCGHINAWNTKALELSGLPETAPDPDGGRYDREADGRLLGVSYERANGPITTAAMPSVEDVRRGLINANHAYLEAGGTSIHDAGGMAGLPIDIATDLVARDELQVRIYAFVTVNALDHPHVGILQTGFRTGFGDTRLRIGAFKVITDGLEQRPDRRHPRPVHVELRTTPASRTGSRTTSTT